MAKYYDVSDWAEMPWYQTGGTREKSIVQNPDTGDKYFFKTSLVKAGKEYVHEFWSEIIASEVGKCLGFNLLRYDIAFCKDRIGCISKSMVTEGVNKLTEGVNYLVGYDNSYDPKTKESRKEYSFQRIKDTLDYFKLGNYIEDIIKIIIFDSIIGNSDRHQENWGIITDYKRFADYLNAIVETRKTNLITKFFMKIVSKILNSGKEELVKPIIESSLVSKYGEFSPIYDSGSCLGRELKDEKVKQMLKDEQQLRAHAYRGRSEIHWEGKKIRYTELIKNIREEYPDFVDEVINNVFSRYNSLEVQEIVNSIDVNLPEDKRQYKLPDERKELIIKLITLRIDKLKEFIS